LDTATDSAYVSDDQFRVTSVRKSAAAALELRTRFTEPGLMADNMILFILLAGMAFVAGAAVALIVSERSLSTRHRRQALRERELTEFSAFINDRLARLGGGHDPRARGGP
jgi:hypothetical protein